MSSQLPNRIPRRILVKESKKFFSIFFYGVIFITSLNDFSLRTLGQRAVSFGVLFLALFIINTQIVLYFDKHRECGPIRIGKKTFLAGFFCSLIFFSLHYFVLTWLGSRGIDLLASHDSPDVTGWRLVAFLFLSTLVLYSFIFLIQNAVLQQYERNRIQKELLELRASNSDAVNQLLRQQIQPHFLFNALNILKSLIKKDSKKAENYLLNLSDFLRISISKNESGVSQIEEELKICNDYMEMQRIRFGDALQYKVEISPEDEVTQKRLPFFSLQPLLENAIKHNSLTKDSPLRIKIEHTEEYIKVSNNLQPKQNVEISTGNGLDMLRKRYQLLNDEPPLIIVDGNIYSIKLKILEDGNRNH